MPQYVTWFNAYVRGVPAEPEEPFKPLRTRGLRGGVDAPSPPSRADVADVTDPKRLWERLRSGVDAPSLPLGTWEVNASGDRGLLHLVLVSHQGELRGTLFGSEIVGVWDDPGQKVLCVRLANPAVPSTAQLYTGYLFRTLGGLRGVGTATYTLAGSFTAMAGPGVSASRLVYGWYAHLGVTE